jgi:hypothetical protein
MQKPNYGGANFYTLTKPVSVKMVDSAASAKAPAASVPPAITRPVLVITGRGKTAGRIPNLVRLRPEVVEDIKSLVDGPLYLTIELALRHYADYLRSRSSEPVLMIKASDLE